MGGGKIPTVYFQYKVLPLQREMNVLVDPDGRNELSQTLPRRKN